MKLHKTAIEKLLLMYANYGGHSNENKLRDVIASMDFTIYEQNKEQAMAEQNINLINRVLVTTEDLKTHLKGK